MSLENPPQPRELKVGGPIDSAEQLYIERETDREFVDFIRAGKFVNIVTSRQMGKTSLVNRAMAMLSPAGYKFAYFDISPLRSETDERQYFMSLVGEIARELDLAVDLEAFWAARLQQSVSLGFVDFFRQVLAATSGPVVVVLDEIDSTLEQGFTDDVFTAIRTMEAARTRDADFKRLTFCLVGVATPNELVKSRRTTPYNIGRTIWLTDFDASRDDLDPLALTLSSNKKIAHQLFDRVMHWTGGQPYLTAWLCDELRRLGANSADGVDEFVDRSLNSLDQLRHDPHFEATERFLTERVANGAEVLGLYERILEGSRESDQVANPACMQLKLSGLVKRDANGLLVPRNRIYERLFNLEWVRRSRPRQEVASAQRESKRARRLTFRVAAIAAVLLVMAGSAFFYTSQRAATQLSQQTFQSALLEVLTASDYPALVALARDSSNQWDEVQVTDEFLAALDPKVIAEEPWEDAELDPSALFDVIDRMYPFLIRTRPLFGAVSFALEEAFVRSSDDAVRERARTLALKVRQAFVEYHKKTPGFIPLPKPIEEEALNKRITLPAGDFTMGNPDGPSDARRVHEAELPKFTMQQHEVTNREYVRFDPTHSFGAGEDLYPVTAVSWFEAAGYAAWLGASLPTETEWEYAAAGTGASERGGQSRIYPWPAGPPSHERAVYSDTPGDLKAPLPVEPSRLAGRTPENLDDMAGNVQEWCRDWYASQYARNPLGPTAYGVDISLTDRRARVTRGGSFLNTATFLMAVRRTWYSPNTRDGAIGFRVVSSRFPP